MATKKERRISIIKDAIKQLKLKNIEAITGIVAMIPRIVIGFNNNDDLKPLLERFFKKKDKKECYACARGTLLLCTIHKENDFNVGQYTHCSGSFNKDSVTDRRLLRLFSATQLALMENAFEVENRRKGEYGLNACFLPIKLDIASVNFGVKYKNIDNRLLAIFRNALKNGGIFKP